MIINATEWNEMNGTKLSLSRNFLSNLEFFAALSATYWEADGNKERERERERERKRDDETVLCIGEIVDDTRIARKSLQQTEENRKNRKCQSEEEKDDPNVRNKKR